MPTLSLEGNCIRSNPQRTPPSGSWTWALPQAVWWLLLYPAQQVWRVRGSPEGAETRPWYLPILAGRQLTTYSPSLIILKNFWSCEIPASHHPALPMLWVLRQRSETLWSTALASQYHIYSEQRQSWPPLEWLLPFPPPAICGIWRDFSYRSFSYSRLARQVGTGLNISTHVLCVSWGSWSCIPPIPESWQAYPLSSKRGRWPVLDSHIRPGIYHRTAEKLPRYRSRSMSVCTLSSFDIGERSGGLIEKVDASFRGSVLRRGSEGNIRQIK